MGYLAALLFVAPAFGAALALTMVLAERGRAEIFDAAPWALPIIGLVAPIGVAGAIACLILKVPMIRLLEAIKQPVGALALSAIGMPFVFSLLADETATFNAKLAEQTRQWLVLQAGCITLAWAIVMAVPCWLAIEAWMRKRNRAAIRPC